MKNKKQTQQKWWWQRRERRVRSDGLWIEGWYERYQSNRAPEGEVRGKNTSAVFSFPTCQLIPGSFDSLTVAVSGSCTHTGWYSGAWMQLLLNGDTGLVTYPNMQHEDWHQNPVTVCKSHFSYHQIWLDTNRNLSFLHSSHPDRTDADVLVDRQWVSVVWLQELTRWAGDSLFGFTPEKNWTCRRVGRWLVRCTSEYFPDKLRIVKIWNNTFSQPDNLWSCECCEQSLFIFTGI